MDGVWKSIVRGVVVAVGLVPVVGATIFAFQGRLSAKAVMSLVAAEMASLLFFFGLVVVVAMATGQIRIDKLIGDATGDASVSRFQLLVFTFTIALSFVFLVLGDGAKFPVVPNDVLILLGISASTYGIGKGLQIGASKINAAGEGDEQAK